MSCVVEAEVGDQRRQLALVLHIKRLENIEAVVHFIGLPGHNPVDIGIVVHADTYGSVAVEVMVSAAVDGPRLIVVSQRVEVVEIAVVVLMLLLHGGVEAIASDTDFAAHDRSLESERSEVALHIAKILLSEQLHIFHRGVFAIVSGHRAEAIDVRVEPSEVISEICRRLHPAFSHFEDALLDAPNLVHTRLNSLDDIRVHLLFILQEPRALLALWHIGEDHHSMVERVSAEMRLYAAICRDSLTVELYRINELSLIHEEPREG